MASPSKGDKVGPSIRNEKGGIPVSEEELKLAWDFFDTKNTGKVSAHDIKKRLSTFYKNVSMKEIRYLLNNQQEISFDELYELLKNNQLKNFDPVKEAFRVYDPTGQGHVDPAILRDFFQTLGFGEIPEDDKKLLEMADADGDGRIGLEDFRLMVPFGRAPTASVKKIAAAGAGGAGGSKQSKEAPSPSKGEPAAEKPPLACAEK